MAALPPKARALPSKSPTKVPQAPEPSAGVPPMVVIASRRHCTRSSCEWAHSRSTARVVGAVTFCNTL